jgi:hypothetical protein
MMRNFVVLPSPPGTRWVLCSADPLPAWAWQRLAELAEEMAGRYRQVAPSSVDVTARPVIPGPSCDG